MDDRPVWLVRTAAFALILPALTSAGACSVVTGLDDFAVAERTGPLGAPCVISDQCLSDHCVDGVCCDSACADGCTSCHLTNSVGKCSQVPLGDTDTTCSGRMACDGRGGCGVATGQLCDPDVAECVSGLCVDGVCCDVECSSACLACNVPGAEGGCAVVPVGGNDEECVGPTNACDGALGCKLADGQSCTDSLDCASGVCTGGPGVKVCTGS